MNNPTIQNEYPLAKNSYAAFDAISLRNLIIQRLNDQGLFTDQNYIGSNLASIIDIISFSFNALIYYLNKTSSESTFTEAQLYENINRIVKLLDYKPVGYQTSTLTFQASALDFGTGSYTIPRYSYVTIGNVPFSFNEDISFKIVEDNITVPLTDISNNKLLYQGIYRENPVYTASGDQNEVVPITIANSYIDHANIDVYVYEGTQSRWIQYTEVPSLYTETAFARSYEKRLNQNSVYEITFGDGINGRKLEVGDKVAIYALHSTGPTGVVGPNTLSSNIAKNVLYSTDQTSTYFQIWSDVTSAEHYVNDLISDFNYSKILFDNVAGSTIPVEQEDANSIRKHAPANFKSQYRLVTLKDYETFISTNFANIISNVKVFDNWDYTGKYLKYFNDISVSPNNFRQIVLNSVLYADACNFNNLYICVTPKASLGTSLKYLLPAQKELILSNLETLKVLSTEITFIDPIYKAVNLGVPSSSTLLASDTQYSYLEVVKTLSTRRSDSSIAKEVNSVFAKFFDPANLSIGQAFDYNTLITNILSIDGVSKVRTKRTDTADVHEGLSLFVWNPTYPQLDIVQTTNTLAMREFEIIFWPNIADLINKIKIVAP